MIDGADGLSAMAMWSRRLFRIYRSMIAPRTMRLWTAGHAKNEETGLMVDVDGRERMTYNPPAIRCRCAMCIGVPMTMR